MNERLPPPLLPPLSTGRPGECVGECVVGPTPSSSDSDRSKDRRFGNRLTAVLTGRPMRELLPVKNEPRRPPLLPPPSAIWPGESVGGPAASLSESDRSISCSTCAAVTPSSNSTDVRALVRRPGIFSLDGSLAACPCLPVTMRVMERVNAFPLRGWAELAPSEMEGMYFGRRATLSGVNLSLRPSSNVGRDGAQSLLRR